MKKIVRLFLVAIVAMLGTHDADAQWYVSGSMSYSHSKIDGEDDYWKDGSYEHSEVRNKANVLRIEPEFWYYIKPRIAVGSEVDFVVSASKGDNYASSKNWQFGFCPFIRWDFVSTEHLLLGVKAKGFFYLNRPSSSSENSSYSVDFGIGLSPVVNYKFNEHWGITASMGMLSIGHSKSVAKHISDNGDMMRYEYSRNNIGANLSLNSLVWGVVYTF